MTQSKQYNLKIFCQYKDIELDSEEAQDFLKKKFYEQLIIIKKLKDNKVEPEIESEEEVESYSIIDRLRNKNV